MEESIEVRWSTTKRPPYFWFDMCRACSLWLLMSLLEQDGVSPVLDVQSCEKHVMSCPLSMPVLPEFHFARSSFLLYFRATSVTCRIPWRPQTVNFPFLGTPGSQWNHKMAVPLSKEFFLQDQWNHIIRLFFDV